MPEDTPSTPDAQTDTFYIGLTMAGAASAGAYSGGVFDFLIEALEEWRAAKLDDARKDATPAHNVVIPVISGASAGGVTGALGMIALADVRSGKPVVDENCPEVGPVTARLPLLYEAWVTVPKFVDPAGGSDLLGNEDLEKTDTPVRSLLDVTVLRSVVKTAIEGLTVSPPRRDYLAEETHLYLTLANLRGVPYKIGFNEGGVGDEEEPGYAMLNHGDRRHFLLQGFGKGKFQSWADTDAGEPLPVEGLPAKAQEPNPEDETKVSAWRRLAEAALGGAGFPVVLSAVEITGVRPKDYQKRRWPIERLKDSCYLLPARLPDAIENDPDAKLDFVTVDGGLLDNEPFQLARWSLMAEPPNPNKAKETEADRAVLMIDPFPEGPVFDKGLSRDAGLAAVVARLLPVLLDQVRFKPEEAAAALDDSVFSRFLIAPRRRSGVRGSPQGHSLGEVEAYPLATGLLSGFGGFLSKDFRAHDYQLGRLNCYLFLKHAFVLPLAEANPASGLSNPVMTKGYGALTPTQRALFRSGDRQAGAVGHYQIIPLMGSAATMPTPPKWPRIEEGEVDVLVNRASKRADDVLDRLKEQNVTSPFLRAAITLAWFLFGRRRLERFIRATVLADLIRRDQLKGWPEKTSTKERLALAALADPSYDFRTAEGVAKVSGLEPRQVETLYDENKALVRQQSPAPGSIERLYTLAARKPGWLRTTPIIKDLVQILGVAPKIG